MKKIKFFTCLFLLIGCLLYAPGAYAQHSDFKNELQLQYGWRQYARQDLLFSPMVYRGNALSNGQLTYRRQGLRAGHRLTVSGSLYQAGAQAGYIFLEWRTLDKTETNPTSFALLDLQYTYLRTILKGGKVRMQAGGILENQVGALFYGYGPQSFFGYTFSTGIGPAWQAMVTLSPKHSLEGGISLPVLIWIARSPFAVTDDAFIQNQSAHRTLATLANLYHDGQLATLNELQKLNLQLSYRYALRSRWTASLTYQGEFFRFNQPEEFVAIRTDLLLGVSYHF